MSRRTTTLTFLIALTLTASVAVAGLAPPPFAPLPISEEEPTEEAAFPDPVVLELRSLSRADRRQNHSKSDLGSLAITVHGYEEEYAGIPEDHDSYAAWAPDLTDAQYGLRFDIEGSAPSGLEAQFPEEAQVLLSPFDRFSVVWGDRDTRTDSIDLTVTATWVDRYGRTGPTSDPLHIHDGGASGCSTTGDTAPPAALLLLLTALGALVLRRKAG